MFGQCLSRSRVVETSNHSINSFLSQRLNRGFKFQGSLTLPIQISKDDCWFISPSAIRIMHGTRTQSLRLLWMKAHGVDSKNMAFQDLMQAQVADGEDMNVIFKRNRQKCTIGI